MSTTTVKNTTRTESVTYALRTDMIALGIHHPKQTTVQLSPQALRRS
jgi:hypothetical protein